jgi:bifunctional non-homologous end joining protein LigD
MLAQEISKPFDSNEWLFEIKWDGYRAIAELEGNNVRLYSRNNKVFNQEYPLIVEDLKKLQLKVVLDGEIVLLNSDGRPDFGKLQDYRNNTSLQLCYYVFDILYQNGENLCDLPLIERKELLRKLVTDSEVVRYTDHIIGDGKSFFEASRELNMEGIMAKKMDSLYYPGRRTASWLKIKHHNSREVVIIGFTKPAGGRKYFGSLVLAYQENDGLTYAGHVGTGFNDVSLKEIYEQLEPLITTKSPFRFKVPARTPITWVVPKIVCEVKFSELTKDGIMRHPVFVDIIKKDNQEKMDDPKNETVQADEKTYMFGKIRVKATHVNKVFFPDDNITKGMITDYYLQMGEILVPYLKNRPQSLKRNPNGIKEHGFFQKDAGEDAPPWVQSIQLYSESSHKDIDYILCNNKATLVYLANLGCIEINPWHSRADSLDNPDYLVIDLDPSEKNTFLQVIETANVVKAVLDKAGAHGFCKTSGATGLHIYVPLAAKYTYQMVKDFAYLICMLTHEQIPDFTTLERSLSKRGDEKIYLDHLQNRRGQTIASVYSVRPFAGAPVSTPLKWEEVKEGLSPANYNIFNTLDRIKKEGDLFLPVLAKGIDLRKCLKTLSIV